MNKYKTIIIDGKKISKQILTSLSVFAFLLLFIWGISCSNITIFSVVPDEIIQDTIPAIKASTNNKSSLKKSLNDLISLLLGFQINDSNSIIEDQIPIIKAVSKCGLISLIDITDTNLTEELPSVIAQDYPIVSNIPPERQAPIKETDLSPDRENINEIKIGNETSYSIDIPSLLSSPTTFNMQADGPKILIIHTHATESYSAENSSVYDTEGSDRSNNCNENVVRVGDAIYELFNKKGIETLHDRTLHDVPSFNGSYAHSLTSIEDYLKKYPTIQIVFDIHRDSIIYQDGTKARPVTEIDGKKAAQLMFVVGTDQKGLYHPNWRENIKNAVHFQNEINKKYPSLMRHINLRGERFNGHTTNGSMIIEIGSCGNSLSEAIYGASLASECIADYLLSIR